jgi:mRNA interferase HigB
MLVLGTTVLDRAGRKHPDTRAWLVQWRDVIERARWQGIHDVREAFPAADGVRVESGGVVTVFNVKGNAYRLLTAVHYPRQQVIVIDLLTHAEYSKGAWKKRL